MNIKAKLLLTVFIASLIALATLSGIAVYRMHLISDAALASQKKALLNDYDLMIKGQVQTAVSLLATLESRAAKREIAREEAKKQGADLIRQLRYQKEGYFWIDTVDGTNVVLLGKAVEGKNRFDLQDVKGKYLIREIIDQGRKDKGGYTDYWFPKAGSDTPLPKRGYSLEFKPWGWVVGTGNYIDDIALVMEERQKVVQTEFRTNIMFFIGASFILIFAGLSIGLMVYLMLKNKNRTIELAEEKLRKLSRAVEQSPVTIVITDLQGSIEFVNPKFTELTGYTAEEAIGKNPRILDSGKNAPDLHKDLWSTIRSGNTWQGEFRNKAKDGTLFWERAAISPLLDEHGATTHYLAIKEDITARKNAEEKLLAFSVLMEQKNAELGGALITAEHATQAKSMFLATMSHEIRTPMNGVIGMTGLLLDTELSAEQRQYAEIVNKSGENLLSLINDILDFSKIEAGKLDMEILDFDLRTTLDDTVEMLSLRTSDAGLELICRIDPAVPSHLKGDPGRLRQIITNLAGNAVKFTHAGEIVISADLETEIDNVVVVRFAVSDTGIGIPETRRAAIFAPFTQVDGSTTRKYGGTGLGLAICKQLTEMMGGEIGIESEEGKGSTFWFTAKFEKSTFDAFKTSEVLAHADIHGTNVLVVDDNATNRMLMITLLSHWGCCYEAAADGETGLALLHEAVEHGEPYRIAVLDHEMPGMDGCELGRRIKADPLLNATQMVMLTSLGQRGDAAKLEQIGFAAYLTKPVRQSQLHDCLGMVLGRANQNQISEDSKTSEIFSQVQAIITRHTVSEYTGTIARILLAEDNVINQKVVQHILKKLGYRADVVANGLEAVRALELIDYHLVLMDSQMPEMDGFEATAMIRSPVSKVRNHSVPVIAVTANAMKGDREKCLEAGMDDYLTKPVKKDELAAVLAKWLKG